MFSCNTIAHTHIMFFTQRNGVHLTVLPKEYLKASYGLRHGIDVFSTPFSYSLISFPGDCASTGK